MCSTTMPNPIDAISGAWINLLSELASNNYVQIQLHEYTGIYAALIHATAFHSTIGHVVSHSSGLAQNGS
jgi:hypothetical protein